jgi:hypothetical protein
MKKNMSLNLFSLVAVLTFALVFIGIDFVQGQARTQGKPNKPPRKGKYVWSAVILDNPGLGLKGMIDDMDRYDETWPGWVYDDSESNVNVEVEMRWIPFSGVYQTRFYLEIFNPVQIDIVFSSYEAHFYQTNPLELCIYPGGYEGNNPYSMLYFMQDSSHPHPSYDNVLFRFYTAQSLIRDEADFERWPNNYHEHLEFLANISGPAPMAFKPVTCEDLGLFEYSNIQFGGGDSENGDYGYFERVDEDFENMDIWKVVVGMERDYDYTEPGDGADAWATDWYNICVDAQYKNKPGVTYDAIFSSQGSLDMKFVVLFVRTKQ